MHRMLLINAAVYVRMRSVRSCGSKQACRVSKIIRRKRRTHRMLLSMRKQSFDIGNVNGKPNGSFIAVVCFCCSIGKMRAHCLR